jgi:hypothetical protein
MQGIFHECSSGLVTAQGKSHPYLAGFCVGMFENGERRMRNEGMPGLKRRNFVLIGDNLSVYLMSSLSGWGLF